MAAITTKQSSTLNQGRGISLRHAAAAIVGHETKEVVIGNTFIALCAAPLGENSVAAVVSALYYLPQNFMIMLPNSFTNSPIVGSSIVKSQIKFYDENDATKKVGSFNAADVVIGCETETSIAIVPASKYSELAAKDFSFSVGRSPEAIASSLLNYARDEA